MRGKIIDVARHVFIDHQRQVRLDILQVGLGFGRHIGVSRKRHLVRFINRGWLRLLLGKAVGFFSPNRVQLVDLFGDLVELLLQTVVGLYVHRPLHQYVHCVIKILFGCIQMAGFVVVLACRIGLFCLGDHLWHRIRFFRLWSLRGRRRLLLRSFRQRNRGRRPLLDAGRHCLRTRLRRLFCVLALAPQ